jgi:hypothetical protein
MKPMRLIGLAKSSLVCSLLTLAGGALAQTTSLVDVVTIEATIPDAIPPDHPGLFTITRQGETNYTLYGVIYHIGGTASNGVDYAQIPSVVTIPAGSRAANIFIQPKTNSLSTGDKTVELQIVPSPLMCPSPECGYGIGSPSNATVVIHFSATNAPPYVQLNSPSDGATFTAPATIPLRAYAVDREDGFNLKVEFFNGTNSLGFGVFVPTMCPSPYCPFFALTWSNVPPGAYTLTAKATDSGGASSLSQPVHILVTPPQTNPIVRITSPANGAMFRSPVNIPIYAYAAAPTGSVVSVEFFAGTNNLGAGHIVSPPPWAGPTPPPNLLSNQWMLTWRNASVGQWPLTALATDSAGASAVSPPVRIYVLPPPLPPPTNPPVVIVLALDPIAIEGTNCFPWRGLDPGYPPATWPNWGSSNSCYQWFTTFGPRNALFAIRRFGDTHADLTVSYAVGGTATNGVDYVPLPGSATIPAGHLAVLIPLVPLEDGPPDITSTVILKLVPGSGYSVGVPSSAAAIILDPPLLPTAVLPDKTFHLYQAGPDGAWFHIEATSDLVNWTAICTNQVFHGAIDFIDPDAPGIASRFYRAVPESQPPQ